MPHETNTQHFIICKRSLDTLDYHSLEQAKKHVSIVSCENRLVRNIRSFRHNVSFSSN